jgi:hypothetical protein
MLEFNLTEEETPSIRCMPLACDPTPPVFNPSASIVSLDLVFG